MVLSLLRTLVKTLAKNMVKNLANNLCKNLAKNLFKNMVEISQKRKKVVASKGRVNEIKTYSGFQKYAMCSMCFSYLFEFSHESLRFWAG